MFNQITNLINTVASFMFVTTNKQSSHQQSSHQQSSHQQSSHQQSSHQHYLKSLVHELGHAYAFIETAQNHYGISVQPVVYKQGNGVCSSNAKWDKYREVWGGWERGIVLMAGGVFEFLWLKECGQKPQGDVYSFMREAYSPSVDREYFYKIRESYTDEAEYVSFIEAINWAIDAWENGGRDFVAQYVSFKNGVTSKVTVHEEGDVLYSVDFDITYCKNAEYEFDLYVPLDGNLIDNLKELDEVLIQNGQDISYEEEFVDGAEVICITITITSNNKHLVEQLEKLDYKFKVEPQLDEEDYLLVA